MPGTTSVIVTVLTCLRFYRQEKITLNWTGRRTLKAVSTSDVVTSDVTCNANEDVNRVLLEFSGMPTKENYESMEYRSIY
jgi:hypothetical protein